MEAIRYHFTIPRYLAGKALGKITPRFYWNGLSCTRLEAINEPELPSGDWVKIKTLYAGICGTDLPSIRLEGSPYFFPLTSFPFTYGHEAVGTVEETGSQVDHFKKGDRVVVEPILWCKPRGFTDLCEFCARGEVNLCNRISGAPLGTGLLIGGIQVTGGSWSRSFVAHKSQLYRVPESLSHENALMVEPFACGLHAVLQNFPKDNDTVLIIGAGTIGLMVCAALSALGSQARTVVLARYPHQIEAARKLGACETILYRGSDYDQVNRITGGIVLKTPLGKPVVLGGADQTFVCVGSDSAVDDAARLTRNGGRVVLVSAPGIARNIDWTPILIQELVLKSSYAYHHAEKYQGRTWSTFELGLDLLDKGRIDLGWLVTHKFKLQDYQQALSLLNDRRQSQAIKVAFVFEP